jgi:hypothetical protein
MWNITTCVAYCNLVDCSFSPKKTSHGGAIFLFLQDIIHCHDWSSAPVAWLYKEHYALNGIGNGRIVFTIHNLEFGAHHIGKAMAHCDKATTVRTLFSLLLCLYSCVVQILQISQLCSCLSDLKF